MFLGAAILLQGFIGLFMGLKTFSLMMLVMNMAFLSKDETLWFLGWFTPPQLAVSTTAAPIPETAAGAGVRVGRSCGGRLPLIAGSVCG